MPKAKVSGDFSDKDKTRCLLWCNRHCCLCGRACGTNIEVAHVIRRGENRLWEIDNAIPLCFDCHADIGRYNDDHPKGTKYKPAELKAGRERIYEEHTRHLVPPIHFEITQMYRIGKDPYGAMIYGQRDLPDVGTHMVHLGDSLPVQVRIDVRVYIDGKEQNKPSGYYNEELPWNMNPHRETYGHFRIPGTHKNTKDLKILARVTIIDEFERPHVLLPAEWNFKLRKVRSRRDEREEEVELQLWVPEPSPSIKLPKEWMPQ